MYKTIKDHINDNNRFDNCNKCGEMTSKDKLIEFDGKCEDCYYDR